VARRAALPVLALLVLALVPVRAAAANPVLEITPTCGPSARPFSELVLTYTIEVRGYGFVPGKGVGITFNGQRQNLNPPPPSPPASPPAQTVTADLDTAIDVVIRPAQQAAGVYQVTASQLVLTDLGAILLTRSRTFVVPCAPPGGPVSPPTSPPARPSPSNPTTQPPAGPSANPSTSPGPSLAPSLKLIPAVGPPGTITVASGSGFPASTEVQLSWDQGIFGPAEPVVLTDSQGGFSLPLLIYPRDTLGGRTLAAGPGPSAQPFQAVGAGFEVVAGAIQPSNNFTWRN
jgi:hypothetical protein